MFIFGVYLDWGSASLLVAGALLITLFLRYRRIQSYKEALSEHGEILFDHGRALECIEENAEVVFGAVHAYETRVLEIWDHLLMRASHYDEGAVIDSVVDMENTFNKYFFALYFRDLDREDEAEREFASLYLRLSNLEGHRLMPDQLREDFKEAVELMLHWRNSMLYVMKLARKQSKKKT